MWLLARNSVTAIPLPADPEQFGQNTKALITLITGVRTVARHITNDQKQNEPFTARSYASWLNSTEN